MQRLSSPNQNTSLTASAQRKILVYNPEYHGKKFGKLGVVFGPNYRECCKPFWEENKELALRHVLRKSQSTEPEIMSAIGGVEAEVRAAYADNVVNCLTWPVVQNIMVVDGCFFLLLSFLILGAGTELEFSDEHPVFGPGCVNEHMRMWLESMFFVGNQIPFIVLKKLMELSFLKELKTRLKWKRQLELGKRTLHKFLIVDQNLKPGDLLHCLQSIMLGPKGRSNMGVAKKDDDVADNVTASKLCKRGTKFRKVEGGLGIRGMHYERNILGAVLYLPVLRVDSYTGILVECLLKYEMRQERQGVEPEVSTFFKFICDLIHTPEDVGVLESKGIVEGQSMRLLGLLRSLDEMVLSGNMHSIKREIVGNRPWQWRKPLKWMCIISSILMLVFAFVQMYYAILSYYKHGKP